MNVLVVNAGSSSLKVRLLDDADDVVDALDLGRWSGGRETDELERFVSGLGTVDAVGHRVVHGGSEFPGPVRLAGDVRGRIAALAELAPLHQPRGVAGIDAITAVLPDVAAVACFDTSFHRDLPAAAATYALPRDWNERWGLRRYGFHGLSHAYAARRAAELLGRGVGDLRLVTCHLGAGASLAAVAGGRSVDTTMGFTPLEGLVMATRSGTLDPGLVLWLQDRGGLTSHEVFEGLEHESGLKGLAGSGDMRVVLADAAAGAPGACLALDVYLHRLRGGIASMAAAMGGLDVLVFTGGVAERAPSIRAGAVAGLEFLGLRVDATRNADGEADREIGAADREIGAADREVGPAGAPGPRVLVVTSREDLEIARQARSLLRP